MASSTVKGVGVSVKPIVSSSITVTNRVSLTVPYSPPEALCLNVTVSEVALSSSGAALTVTGCSLSQLLGLKLRLACWPTTSLSVSTVTPLSIPLTVTVTSVLGAFANLTV